MATQAHPEATHGVSRKRKEPPRAEPSLVLAQTASPAAAGNRLLAGYLAHEFLTKGTLLGQRWDPARPGQSREAEPVQPEPAKGSSAEPGPAKPERAYADVAWLLKADGVHIPGVLNPTQLAQWLQS